MLDYFPLYPEDAEIIEELSLEARGELLTAILAYAFEGQDNKLETEARYVWPAVKSKIRACEYKSQYHAANGAQGGRPSKNQTKANETKQNQTKPNKSPESESESETKTKSDYTRAGRAGKKTVNAQMYGQRDYSAVQEAPEEMMRRLMT